ncbi:MAG TPA: transglutaminaseTgpA domain-containing protein [Streptosporangiaceae bacterium]
MNHRITIAAAVSVVLASVSIFSLVDGAAWYVQASGAVVIVALAGTLSRISPVPAAIGASLLAAIASVPLLAAQSPFLKATGAVIILACVASASGLRPLRAVAGLVSYLAALLIYLNVLQAAAQSFLAVIPTPRSVHHLATLVGVGASAASGKAPVHATHGVILLAAGSIGLVAVTVDFLAVRLHRPAIAGLPLLVVFMAPIVTPANVRGLASAVAFLLAAAGYLALLSSDGRGRLRGWGRVVTVWHYAGEDDRLAGADMGALAATGRRIGLAAVCAALIAPLLVPGLTLHQIFGGHGTGGGGGGGHQGVGLPNPVAQLHGLLTRSRPHLVLTYHTNIPDPSNYLQVYVLNYDSRAGDWDLVRPTHGKAVGRRPLAQAPGLAFGTPESIVSTRISIPQARGFSGPIDFLPVPYWPMRANVPGNWREDPGTLMIYSNDAPTDGLQYTVTSGQVEPTASTLAAAQHVPAAIKRAYLGFPSKVTPQLTTIARRVTKGKTTAFDKAVALEHWFLSNRFSYALQSTNLPNSPRGLLTFLTTDREGFCQQFAFAMAVLARLLGIPSRVAIGFTAGHQQANGAWTVTTADAHAWPELYFSGIGWLRFEPTPGGSGGQQTAVEPAYVASAVRGGGQTGNQGGTGQVPSVSPSAGATKNIGPHLRGPGAGGVGDTSKGQSGGVPAAPIVLAVLALIAVTPATIRLVSRRRRWRTASGDGGLAGAAWLELCADLDDYGLPCRASESPRALSRRVSGVLEGDEQGRQAVGRIAAVVERARYAPVPAAPGAIRTDVTTVRRALARNASHAARWRARLLPASTLQPLRAWLRQTAGLLTGWMPASGEN